MCTVYGVRATARSTTATIKFYKIKHIVLAPAYSRGEQALLPPAFVPQYCGTTARQVGAGGLKTKIEYIVLALAYSHGEQAPLPSALECLTSVFGMGTGVPTPPKAPRLCILF